MNAHSTLSLSHLQGARNMRRCSQRAHLAMDIGSSHHTAMKYVVERLNDDRITEKEK
jgi:hypothetical protein